MRLIRLLALATWFTCILSELTTRERIELHRAWLEKRATIKELLSNNNSTATTLFNPSLIKLNDSLRKDLIINKHKKYDSNKNDVLFYDNKENVTLDENTFETTTPMMLTQNHNQTTSKPIIIEKTTTESTVPIITTTTTTPIPNTNLSISKSNFTIAAPKRQKIRPININRKTPSKNDTRPISRKRQYQRNSNWGSWQQWTECSRSCGGGIMSQKRDCLYRNPDKKKTSTDCIGLYKRYRICNEQSCPDPDVDFREQQCSNYNNKTFRGQKYVWEAYIKEDAECELNCKPIGMSYFATLNDKVIDGTICSRPTDYLKRNYAGSAVCVEGLCKAVHSSGIITGAFMNNGAVRCGSLICRPVSGLYTKDPLPKGYVHVATIPIGASNISITELKNSKNLLVLKFADQKYIINGDYSISLSGVYEAAGTIFDYRRIDGLSSGSDKSNRKAEGVTEWITCTGPITEPVHLMVLSQERNPGIKYEYLIPINANGAENSEESSYEMTSGETEQPPTTLADNLMKHTLKSGSSSLPVTTNVATKFPEKRKRRFFWKVVGFSACSKSCGGGTQSPVIRCVRENPLRYFKTKRCAHLTKPSLNENLMRCNTQPCPAYWKISEWGECICRSHPEESYQKREIKCVQEISPAMVIQVPVVACADERPVAKQNCDCPKTNEYQDRLSLNGINSIKNRIFGVSKMPITIYGDNSINKRGKPIENKKSGVWLTSDWNQQCSTKCGDGIQYRSIFCDRSPPKIDRCDTRYTPDISQQCSVNDRCNIGDWFTGPWSQCSGDCFNLTQSRSIYCIENNAIVNETKCEASIKPITLQQCSMSDVTYCKPKWYYSEWTECNKKCGEGSQRRTVKCYESIDGELRLSDNCRYSERQPGTRVCNTHSCDSTTEKLPDPSVDLIQNDITPECKDELQDCHLVVQEHLCQFVYFKENCCETCRVHLG